MPAGPGGLSRPVSGHYVMAYEGRFTVAVRLVRRGWTMAKGDFQLYLGSKNYWPPLRDTHAHWHSNPLLPAKTGRRREKPRDRPPLGDTYEVRTNAPLHPDMSLVTRVGSWAE